MIPEKFKKFVRKLKKDYGFIVDEKSMFYDKFFYLVFEKEEESCVYTLNINITLKEIAFYKVPKLIATNYNELFNEMNSIKALAYPVPYELMKLVVDNYDTIYEMKDEVIKRREECNI